MRNGSFAVYAAQDDRAYLQPSADTLRPMKRLLVLLAFATPLFAVTTNDDCRGYQQLATLYQVRELMLRGAGDYRINEVIDAQLGHLREGWVRWVRPDHDAPRDKHVHVVAASEGSKDNFEASGEHPFEVKVVVPSKRSLLNRNNPVYVGTLHVSYTAGGRTRTKDQPINAWMNPDTSKTLDLGGIAEHAEASVDASTRNVKEAVVEIHFIQAAPEDDPANPAYDTIQSLQHVRRNTDESTIDDEIAKSERALFPSTEPLPLAHIVHELRRADELMRSKKEDDQKKGERLMQETLRRLR
jgi:hypothetical protein